jgi:hypothetical protein
VDAGALCVECRRQPVDPVWRPFCSERCKLVDLGRWLNGEYRVPGAAVGASPAPDRSDDPGEADLTPE